MQIQKWTFDEVIHVNTNIELHARIHEHYRQQIMNTNTLGLTLDI